MRLIDRRTFLGGAGLAAAAAVLGEGVTAAPPPYGPLPAPVQAARKSGNPTIVNKSLLITSSLICHQFIQGDVSLPGP